jgi:hypothetical protein
LLDAAEFDGPGCLGNVGRSAEVDEPQHEHRAIGHQGVERLAPESSPSEANASASTSPPRTSRATPASSIRGSRASGAPPLVDQTRRDGEGPARKPTTSPLNADLTEGTQQVSFVSASGSESPEPGSTTGLIARRSGTGVRRLLAALGAPDRELLVAEDRCRHER